MEFFSPIDSSTVCFSPLIVINFMKNFRVGWKDWRDFYCSLLLCRDELLDKGNSSVASVWLESWTAMKAVTKVQTFQIIVLQGVVGSLPWTAMVFFTMWFELIGKPSRNLSVN